MSHHFQIRRLAGALCLLAPMLLAPLSAHAQNRMNAKAVAVTSNGPVTNVEAVNFAGSAVVNSRLVPDPEFGRPSLVMQFDLTGVTGTGAKSGIKYVLTSQEHVVKPFASNQNVEFTFPMATDENAPIAKVRTGSARFVMNVEPASGLITSVNAVLTAR
ncbi:MAG: hypothetical protein JWR74_1773 [Polaromonas sp.]|jgi:hypothetical protein|nr:hypothetical protein [Polaromonas sp.]